MPDSELFGVISIILITTKSSRKIILAFLF